MASKARFLSIPRELRDIIYRYYLSEDNGYQFDFESRKLRASNRPIDLALMYTSRQVAAEMEGLAFEFNTVTFSTACPETRSDRLRAGRFDRIMHELMLAKIQAVAATGDPELRDFRTPEVVTELNRKWPRYVAGFDILDRAIDEEEPWMDLPLVTENAYGEASSERVDFMDRALSLLTWDPDFVEALAESNVTTQPAFVRSRLLLSSPKPWTIPIVAEVTEMERALAPRRVQPYSWAGRRCANEVNHFWKMIKWRYSACAVAILFLNSLTARVRVHMRRILLVEDRESICRPECHVLGLIRFCLENPAVHIERRVNIWRNLLPAKSNISMHRVLYELGERITWSREADTLNTCDVTGSLCGWLTEALALHAAGMPAQSFSLVFDGDPVPEQSSALFEIVKLDAAWQVAFDQWQQRIPRIRSDHDWMTRYNYQQGVHRFDAFPSLITKIVDGNSFIRCNFPLGGPWDLMEGARKLFESYQYLPNPLEWSGSRERSYPSRYTSTEPPLPHLHNIRLEDIMEEEPLSSISDEDEMPTWVSAWAWSDDLPYWRHDDQLPFSADVGDD